MKIKYALMVLATCLIIGACGKKGDPVAPTSGSLQQQEIATSNS